MWAARNRSAQWVCGDQRADSRQPRGSLTKIYGDLATPFAGEQHEFGETSRLDSSELIVWEIGKWFAPDPFERGVEALRQGVER